MLVNKYQISRPSAKIHGATLIETRKLNKNWIDKRTSNSREICQQLPDKRETIFLSVMLHFDFTTILRLHCCLLENNSAFNQKREHGKIYHHLIGHFELLTSGYSGLVSDEENKAFHAAVVKLNFCFDWKFIIFVMQRCIFECWAYCKKGILKLSNKNKKVNYFFWK